VASDWTGWNRMSLISDLRVASGREYEIDEEGFVPGSLQYVDRDYTFDHIPNIALGATHIRTAGNDKTIDESEICMSFKIAIPSTIFVIYADKLRVPPRWLGGFIDTREKVTRTDSNTSTLKGIFTLFAKDFEPGTIILSGNLSQAMADDPAFRGSMGTNYCMYSVAVKERGLSSNPDAGDDL
jgi:hypothetical protein